MRAIWYCFVFSIVFTAMLCNSASPLLSAQPGSSPRKFALVIGNSHYNKLTPPLIAAGKDAEAFTDAMVSMGFTIVAPGMDLNHTAFANALDTLAKEQAAGGIVVFYYAGHASQINGVNFLAATDSSFSSAADLRSHSVSLEDVFAALQATGSAANVVVLDACRENPLVHIGTDFIPGLAQPQHPSPRTLIAFATAPNHVAPDDNRGLTPFTRLLLKYSKEPGVPIDQATKKVTEEISEFTGDDQVPWTESSLTGTPVYFRLPVVINLRFNIVDDDAFLQIDGDTALTWDTDGTTTRTYILKPGTNRFVISIYNARTFTGGVEGFGGHLPEGWKYSLDFFSAFGSPTLHLEDGETLVEKDGPRHGKTFVVATGELYVDPESGSLTTRNLNQHAWLP